MGASGKCIKILNGQLASLISLSSLLDTSVKSHCKRCLMEGRLPPSISYPSGSSHRLHKAQIWPKSCLPKSRQRSVYPGNSANWAEKGRPAPYKLKTSTWNSIPISSPRRLGWFPAATIAQALPARCKSQSLLRTVAGFRGTKSLVWKDFFYSIINLIRCPQKT